MKQPPKNFFPTIIVGTVVPTMISVTVFSKMTAVTAVPTRDVGTAAKKHLVPAIVVGTAAPTIIVITAYYWKSCSQNGCLAECFTMSRLRLGLDFDNFSTAH